MAVTFPIKDVSGNLFMDSIALSKIEDYLYEVNYKNYSYEKAEEYFKTHHLESPYKCGYCSSFRKDNFYARNLDWYYDHQVDFIIHTPARDGRHAVLGVAGTERTLTKDVVETGKYVESYKILPFKLLDGINDAGLVSNINIVPAGDFGYTNHTNPGGREVYGVCIVRYILDNCATVDEAIDLVKEIDWYGDGINEIHCMVADGTKSAVIEFVNNKIVIFTDADDEYLDFPDDKVIMTNFYLAKDEESAVAANKIRAIEATALDPADTDLTAHAMGVERYKILANAYANVDSAAKAMAAIKSVSYAQSYGEGIYWYTEFTDKDHPIYLPQSDFTEIIDDAKRKFPTTTRDKGLAWQTTHTSLYDIENKTLTICSQEMEDTYNKELNFYLTKRVIRGQN